MKTVEEFKLRLLGIQKRELKASWRRVIVVLHDGGRLERYGLLNAVLNRADGASVGTVEPKTIGEMVEVVAYLQRGTFNHVNGTRYYVLTSRGHELAKFIGQAPCLPSC